MFSDKHNQQLPKIQTLRPFKLLSGKGTGFLFFKGLHLEGAAVRAEVSCRREPTGACKPAAQTGLSALRLARSPDAQRQPCRGMDLRLHLDGDIFRSAWERPTWFLEQTAHF